MPEMCVNSTQAAISFMLVLFRIPYSPQQNSILTQQIIKAWLISLASRNQFYLSVINSRLRALPRALQRLDAARLQLFQRVRLNDNYLSQLIWSEAEKGFYYCLSLVCASASAGEL